MGWLEKGRYLYQLARLFLANEALDRGVLALLREKAHELAYSERPPGSAGEAVEV
jgi:hypothetical protein